MQLWNCHQIWGIRPSYSGGKSDAFAHQAICAAYWRKHCTDTYSYYTMTHSNPYTAWLHASIPCVVAASEIGNNHLGVYKQPYSPRRLSDCKCCMFLPILPNWLNNLELVTLHQEVKVKVITLYSRFHLHKRTSSTSSVHVHTLYINHALSCNWNTDCYHRSFIVTINYVDNGCNRFSPTACLDLYHALWRFV